MKNHHFNGHSMEKYNRIVAPIVVIAMLAVWFLPIQSTQAAALTAMKDTMSRIQVSQLGTHAFAFTTATSLTAAQTIELRFNTGTSDWTLDGTIVAADFSAVSGMTIVDTCTGGPTNEVQPTVTNGANDFYTFTVCSSDTVTAGAIAFTFDNNEITNPSGANTYKIDITTTSDSGSLAVVIITDDTVDISASVDPSVTFSISDVSVGFGVLSATLDCFANATPPANCDTTFPPTAAHTMDLGTNADGGVVLTYTGATLTSGGNTITVATIAGDTTNPVGTIGSEQFFLGIDDNGTALTIASGYDQNAGDYKFVATGINEIANSATNPVATTTMDVHYGANISAATEAGAYNTSITYIATGTF